MLRHPGHESCGYTHNLATSGSGAEKQVTQAEFVQRLFFEGGKWKIYDHSHAPAAQVHTLVSGGFYVPDFFVRGLKIEGTGLYLAYDMPGTIKNGVSNFMYARGQFASLVLYPVRISGLYLDNIRAQTTCDAVELWG